MYPGYYQNAYVTTDVDRAMEQLNRAYRIKDWAVLRDFSYAPLPGKSLKMVCALAYVGDTQFEIIQPISGDDEFYRTLFDGPGFQLKFHHYCICFDTAEQYHEHRAYLKNLGVAMPVDVTPDDMGTGLALASYADFRDILGHYLEYVWFTQAGLDWMASIPRN
jgi:hypothetical protein